MDFKIIGLGTDANDGTGDNLRTAGGKINDNFAMAVENRTLVIPAAAMLPLTTGSAYYLEGVLPAQIFSQTAAESVKMQLFDVGNQIPAGADGIKVRFAVRLASVSGGGTDIRMGAAASWVYENDNDVTYGTAAYSVITIDGNAIVYSDQSAAITPTGNRKDDVSGLWIKVTRDATHGADDLDAQIALLWVEIEFVTVE